MHDAPAIRKPRLIWLILPFALVAAGFAMLSGWWVYSKGRIERDLDDLTKPGHAAQVSFHSRGISGYPFRIELTLDQPSLVEASGWALSAPRLEAAASVFDPSHIVVVAPNGVTLTRPGKGAIAIDGKVLRASAGGFGHEPRFDIEAQGFTLRPAPGATPMPFTSADRFEAHLRPETGDNSRLFVALDGAVATPDTAMGRATTGKSSLKLEATLNQAHAFAGRDWPSVLRTWQAAGGEMRIVNSQAQVAGATLSAGGSALGLEPDGNLHGKLDLHLTDGPAAMLALGGTGILPPDTAAKAADLAPKQAHVTLKFRAGETMVGPISIGKSPRLF